MARPGNPNIREDNKATRWKPGFRPPGAGRRPKQFNRFCKGERLSSSDVAEIAAWILKLKPTQFQKEIENQNNTILIRGLLIALAADMKNYKRDTIIELINRAAGLPTQHIDMRSNNVVTQLSPEDRKKRIAELEEKRRARERENQNQNP